MTAPHLELLNRTNNRLANELADLIACAINARSVASENVRDIINAKPFDYDTYVIWRDHHIEATLVLATYGINVATFETNTNRERSSSSEQAQSHSLAQ
jgi:hypothetical protein